MSLIIGPVMAAWESGVSDPNRVTALEETGLFGTGPEDEFDRLIELLFEVTDAPRCCMSLVDASQFAFKAAMGLPSGARMSGQIADSFCRYVVGFGRPLFVEDAHSDPRVQDNRAITLYGVRAWAGYPIQDSDGFILGTLCLIDTEAHVWSEREIVALATLSKAVSTEIAIRSLRQRVVAALKEVEELKRGQVE